MEDYAPVEFARHELPSPGLLGWQREERWWARFRYARLCRRPPPIDISVLSAIAAHFTPDRYGDLADPRWMIETVIPGFIAGDWSNETHRTLARLPPAAKERLREIAWRRDTAHHWACAQLAGPDGAPEWATDPDWVSRTLAERGFAPDADLA